MVEVSKKVPLEEEVQELREQIRSLESKILPKDELVLEILENIKKSIRYGSLNSIIRSILTDKQSK